MAQGREWTTEEREVIIQSLKPYLEMGYSRNKACNFIGLAPQTLSNWISEDESLGIKIQSWENVINTTVMANLKDAIDAEARDQEDKRKETSKWWAERRMKEDFSTKTEQDITTGGESLKGVVILPSKNDRPEDTLETTT